VTRITLRRLASAALALTLLAPACRVAPLSSVEQTLRGHVGFLASDAMAGRDTARPEGRITAEYVAAQLEALGLEPGAGDSFLQEYPLLAARVVRDETSASVDLGVETLTWTLGEDWVVVNLRGRRASLDAGIVLAGHGIVADWAGVDEYEGLDVEGRVALVFEGAPEGRDDLGPAASWRAKRDAARAAGAAALARIVDREDEGHERAWTWAGRASRRTSYALPVEEGEAPFPILLVTRAAADPLLDGDAAAARRAWRVGETRGRALDARLRLDVPVETETLAAFNTVAVLRGGDPALDDEYVLLSAHMDHVGVRDDGRVHNGADDNASGTATLLAVAGRLARRPPPRRSVLFLAVSGEEKGLLGSRWWVRRPTVPIDAVVANVNMDMVGRNAPDEIGATPSPRHPMYNTLVEDARDLAPEAGLTLSWSAGEGRYEQPVDELYHRSDHANFAEAGIPVVFFFSGLHEDYHQPTDTVEKLDFGKIARVTDLIARLTGRVADAVVPPRVLGVQAEG